MKTIIRARRHDEIETSVALLADVHAVDSYPLHWPADPRSWLTPRTLLAAWVAEADDDLVGHVVLCRATDDPAAPVWCAASGLPVERLAVVARLFVAPRAHGCGLGAGLLEVACRAASSRQLCPVLAVLDHNRAAIALYERAGWQRVASAPAPWAGAHAVLHYYLGPG